MRYCRARCLNLFSVGSSMCRGAAPAALCAMLGSWETKTHFTGPFRRAKGTSMSLAAPRNISVREVVTRQRLSITTDTESS